MATMGHPDNPLLLPGGAQFFVQSAIGVCRSLEHLFTRKLTNQDTTMGLLMLITVVFSFVRHDETLVAWFRRIIDALSWSKRCSQRLDYSTAVQAKFTMG